MFQKSSSMLLLRNLACCWLLLIPLTNAEEKNSFDELVRLLSVFTAYKAEFVQKSHDRNGKEIQSLTGLVRLQKPDHFFWKSDAPYEQVLVSNGRSIWHYDVDLEQVVVQDYSSQVSQAPILVVFEDAAALARTYKIAKITRKDDAISFNLHAIDEHDALESIRLEFVQGKLSGLDFTDNLQQKTHIRFGKIELNPAMEPGQFEFEIPPGVDVLHE